MSKYSIFIKFYLYKKYKTCVNIRLPLFLNQIVKKKCVFNVKYY